MKIFLARQRRSRNLSSKGCFRESSSSSCVARSRSLPLLLISPLSPLLLNVSHRYISFALSRLPRYLGLKGKSGIKVKGDDGAHGEWRLLGLGLGLGLGERLLGACCLSDDAPHRMCAKSVVG